VTGSLTLSGGLNETRDGEVQLLGGGGGPSCEGQARTVTALAYYYTPTAGSHFELSLNTSLPKGQVGPGTYSVTSIAVNYWSPTGPASSQMWQYTSKSGQAVLELRSDGSGTLSATGLQTVNVSAPTSGHPLSAMLAFTCG
jgi:hypothetical protein